MDTSLKRIIAYVIDIAIVTILVTFISQIKVINPYLEDYNKTYEEYNELLEDMENEEISKEDYQEKLVELNYELGKYNVSNGIITIVSLILYFGVLQMMMHGQTVGKRIMKLKLTYKNDNKELNFGNYLIRTIILNNIIFRILIIAGVFFLNKNAFYKYTSTISFCESIIESVILIMVVLKKDNRGLHDLLAGTRVISLNPVVDEDFMAKEDNAIEAEVVEKKKTKRTSKKKK